MTVRKDTRRVISDLTRAISRLDVWQRSSYGVGCTMYGTPRLYIDVGQTRTPIKDIQR